MTSAAKGNTDKDQHNSARRVRIGGDRHDPPNIRKLAKVLAEIAAAMTDTDQGHKRANEASVQLEDPEGQS